MELQSVIGFLIFYGLLSFVAFLVTISILLLITTHPYPVVHRCKEEESYDDVQSGTRLKFPSLTEQYSVNLSVIVPAYNEEERLPAMLEEAVEFLQNRVNENRQYKYEIIIVSDGSKDKTVEVSQSYAQKYGSDKIRCLKLIKNRGKGGAVRLGVQSARGATILFADADGASKFDDLVKLESSLKETIDYDPCSHPNETADSIAIVIGSRAHLEKESLATRSLFRNILMYGFHFLVWLFSVKHIKDTQCGFKLFTRKAADICFSNLHVNRWAFDVELLFIAEKLHIPIKEIPIRWTEIEGSKVTPVISWIQMGCDLGLIWLKYKIGAWKIKNEKLE